MSGVIPPLRRFWPACEPIAAGLIWLALGWRAGMIAGLVASVPGALMLSSGVALFLWPGDRQITHYMALGALAAVLLALPMAFLATPLVALILGLVGIASYWMAGYAALYQRQAAAGMDALVLKPGLAAKVALDEALLAYFVGSAHWPDAQRVRLDQRELEAARACIRAENWAREPARLHTVPAAPDDAALALRRAGGRQFLHLRFSSDYVPHPDLPGGQRWLAHAANRQAHAWVFRHSGGSRPWVLGIHGYRMGVPRMDFGLFHVDWLHHALGCNVILPVLPLHGPRKAFRRSGSGYLDGYLCDLLHAETQAMRDIRRCLAWIREREPDPHVGVLGFSLGGYNAALLASLEPDLQCVIAGIPATDLADLVWRHLPLLHRDYLIAQGLTPALAEQALAPVSPLNAAARVPRERRFIVAAAGDQLIPSAHVEDLAQHWEQPQTHWYPGSHLSVRREASANEFITRALVQTGLASGTMDSIACSRGAETGE